MRGSRLFAVSTLLGLLMFVFAIPAGAQASPTATESGTDTIATASGVVSLTAPDAAAAGPYRMQFRHSGRCVDNPGFSLSNGTWLDQWNCVYQTNELWYLDYVFTDSNGFPFYRVRNVYSGKCVNIAGGSYDNGAHVIQYTCGSYDNEYFVFWRDSNVPAGYWWVQAYHSGKVLNISGASTANGAKLIQYTRGYYNNEYVRLY
jgi:hypothetical protein